MEHHKGVCSPILANIYLDRLDPFVEQELLPQFNRGKRRRNNQRYHTLSKAISRKRSQGKWEEARALRKQAQQLPSHDAYDPNYRRLHYVRYADDFLLSFIGPKAEAEQIKDHLARFLRTDLKLDLSPEKTLITHARTQAARFLGYEIVSQFSPTKHDDRGRRSINGIIGLRVPGTVIIEKCARYQRDRKPIQRTELMEESDFSILYQLDFIHLVDRIERAGYASFKPNRQEGMNDAYPASLDYTRAAPL